MSDSKAEHPEDDVEMGFFEHLAEFRVRLIRAVIGLVPGVAAGWIFREQIYAILVEPLRLALKARNLDEKIHFISPIDPFVAYLKIAILAGILVSAPWIFWQLWAFVSPGLYRREKRLALPFVFASTVCFLGGAAFGYIIVFPMAFDTLLGFGGTLPSGVEVTPTIMMGEYFSFTTRLLLAFGFVFEVPVAVTFLAAAGIVDWRQLLSFGRWWVVISTVLAAFLTPPDVGSQLLMLIPLVVLYFMSVGLAWIFGYRRKKAAEAEARAEAEAEANT